MFQAALFTSTSNRLCFDECSRQRVDGLGVPLIELHGFRAAAGIINGRYRRLPISGTNIGANNWAPANLAQWRRRCPNAPVTRQWVVLCSYFSPNEISACIVGLNCGLRYLIR